MVSVDLWQTQVCIQGYEFPGGLLKPVSLWRMGKKVNCYEELTVQQMSPLFTSWCIWVCSFQASNVMPMDCSRWIHIAHKMVYRFLSVHWEKWDV